MRWLYHIVPAGSPAAPPGPEGFVHASFQPAVATSARLYVPPGAPLDVLQIDPRRVRHEVVATPRGPMPHILEPVPDGAIVARLPLDEVVDDEL